MARESSPVAGLTLLVVLTVKMAAPPLKAAILASKKPRSKNRIVFIQHQKVKRLSTNTESTAQQLFFARLSPVAPGKARPNAAWQPRRIGHDGVVPGRDSPLPAPAHAQSRSASTP